MTGSFLLSISVFVFSFFITLFFLVSVFVLKRNVKFQPTLFFFGSVRQIKLAIRQLLSARIKSV